MSTSRSLKLGRFLKDQNGNLSGNIFGLGMGSTVVVSEPASSPTGLQYLKLIADPYGSAYQVGVAFPREKDAIGYYSVILESPLFRDAINGSIYPDRFEPQAFHLIWNKLEPPAVTPDTQIKGSQRQPRSMSAAAAP